MSSHSVSRMNSPTALHLRRVARRSVRGRRWLGLPCPVEVDEVHPWMAKARAIDAVGGGSDLSAETLARFELILRAAAAGARRGIPGRRRAGPAGQAAPRRAG